MSSPPDSSVPRHNPPLQGGRRDDDTVEVITVGQQFSDRRAEPRENAGERSALLLLSNRDIIPCRILDQSVSGARVAFDALPAVPGELWLIDPQTNTVKRGAPAWSMPSRMGLKFSFILALIPGAPKPPKIPQPVYDAWLNASGSAAGPSEDDDGVLYFD